MHIRRDRMNQFGLAIHTDMRFHAEVPQIPFLRLTHLRIPLFRAILRRNGGTDDGGIHDGPVVDLQPMPCRMCPNPCKELGAYLMRLQQMTELADRGLIRNRLAA